MHEAEDILRDLAGAAGAGRRVSVGDAPTYPGRVAALTQRFDEALALFDEAQALYKDVGARDELVQLVARRAECRAQMRSAKTALELTDEARAPPRLRGSVAPARVSNARCALAQLGRLDEARGALDTSLEMRAPEGKPSMWR